MMSGTNHWNHKVRIFGRFLGPLAGFTIYFLIPDSYINSVGEVTSFSHAGRATLAVMAWMGIWWLTEAIDISATALLPIALFPLLSIANIKATTAPYATDLIFLFMGGFMLALAMQRWGLDRRIALLALRVVGTRPTHMIGGFMLITAILSAFVSNTATTAMMLPIGLSVINLMKQNQKQDGEASGVQAFAICSMLGIAYAASIGGIATIIGTPPNLFVVSFIRDTIAEPYRQDISFVRWMGIGLPLVIVFLPLTWLLLTRVLFRISNVEIEGGRAMLKQQYRELGKLSRGEWNTLLVFVATIVLWITRPYLQGITVEVNGTQLQPLSGLSDPGIAITAALVLFLLPAERRYSRFTLDWTSANKLPWGILVLFGGGLSLASAVKANGVTEFIGAQASVFSGIPLLLIVLGVVTAIIFLTELTSNTATTATLVPVLAAIAPSLGLHPYTLIVPAAVAASCAFMMPVATPPNAIVFGSGYVTIPQMCRTGIWLNLAGIVLITLIMYAIAIPLLVY